MAMRREPTEQEIRDQRMYVKFGLTDDEYARICTRLGRLPNYTETGVFSVMWSEHCSYKSSRKHLRRFPTQGTHVLQGPGENAGIIDIGDNLAVSFKMESHNHPTAVEPYQGAATGVGGIIRDVFTMGARPIALLNSLRFGTLDQARTRYLFSHAVEGIAFYGNCIGIPTVGGEVVFDARYAENPLVNAMCIGLMTHDQIATGHASGVGNPVLVVGAKTGRDGIHGATFASAQDPNEKERSAVQVGDPFMEKLLLEACLELIATGRVVGIQDMGAAGLTSSSAEMASRAGSGLTLDVSRVPCRETGMSPYEIMLSESQERMLVVMKEGESAIAEEIFAKWGLEATVIGRVTDDGSLRITEGERVAAELPIAALVDEAPVLDRPAVRPAYLDQLNVAPVRLSTQGDLTGDLLALVAEPTIASKEWVYRQYDTMVRTETLVRPGADAAVIGIPDSQKAIATSADGNGKYVYLNPRQGGAMAVAEAARNIVCTGARPLAVTDCLNYGNPEKPEIFYQFRESIDGMSEACEKLGTPVISGNVSFYNETGGQDIYPTPIIGMVGLLEQAERLVTSAFKRGEGAVYLLAPKGQAIRDGLGGSAYLAMKRPDEALSYQLPAFDLDAEKAVQDACLALAEAGVLAAAHDISDGGLAVALAESCVQGSVGLAVAVTIAPDDEQEVLLFGESPSRILVQVRAGQEKRLKELASSFLVSFLPLGAVAETDRFHITLNEKTAIDAEVSALRDAWRGAIASWMN
ncbi:phosphoribosylformylglycinamidine synthase subunit PurL [Ferroacidibacillus organovorans]|uniref:Phosphoribosylformylglycinamidine synthase subunit PurL n=1 Tax=Ferroacidibacillus organovorans TaxID=1765683 RepID=A0A853KD93_9BACL|nr:phosphoribosylformylglycinamidine synthase subunit PurL [Ferroacidibacillus organovorans]KYP80146.1 phosphoribosylformylglycinamidine synthase II [Ferroacidibacillus organovorans]OAG95022.1 phosphoribosylformylglycinamidine synthase [Ferroacidibacillus organovorans]